MDIISTLHVACAIYATLIGAYVLFTPKGTNQHKMLGRTFMFAMLSVNVSAFMLYPKHGFTIFQPLAVISLIYIVLSLYFVVKKPNKNWLTNHYYFICYAYLGVTAAALARFPLAFGIESVAAAFIMIAITFALGGYLIERNVKTCLPKVRPKKNVTNI
jgi:uncharacterized membrane protein